MDGYAARSDDLAQAVVQFRLAGESCASGPSLEPLPIGIAVRIPTGAPMPAGADRVVMREYADVEGGNVIRSDSGQHRYALRCTHIWSVAIGPWVMDQCFLLSTGGRRASQPEKYKRSYRSFRWAWMTVPSSKGGARVGLAGDAARIAAFADYRSRTRHSPTSHVSNVPISKADRPQLRTENWLLSVRHGSQADPRAVFREGTPGRTICEGDQMGCQARFESMQRPAL